MRKQSIIAAGLIILAGALFCVPAFSCIDWSVGFSTEVLLTKPGVTHDMAKLTEAIDVKHQKIHFDSVEGLAYVSHYNSKVVVIIAEDVLHEPVRKPEGNGYDYIETKGLDIMIQIPYKFGKFGAAEAVNVNRKTFDFGAAMAQELRWLQNVGVLQSFSDEDIAQIIPQLTEFSSGKGARIVYLKEKWMPSGGIEGLEQTLSIPKGVEDVSRGGSCSGRSLDPEQLLELVK